MPACGENRLSTIPGVVEDHAAESEKSDTKDEWGRVVNGRQLANESSPSPVRIGNPYRDTENHRLGDRVGVLWWKGLPRQPLPISG